MALARSVWLKLEKTGVPCVFISWEEQEAEAEASRRVVEDNNLRILDEPVWFSCEGSDAEFWAGVSERNADEAAFSDEAAFWERNREFDED